MTEKDIAVKVESLSKVYRIGVKEQSQDNLAQAAWGLLKSPIRNYKKYRSLYRFDDLDERSHDQSAEASQDTIWALRGVSFEVKKGEALGIIGKNGAGKSTLLKILSRIVEPTKGCAEIRGRVSSLLEVGTGFHPELTGRENVYLNGTVLGMRKREIIDKFDEIVAFSGVEQFIDTPVKRYSSGMKVRLAFSVAAHLEPEILIIDEVLAVGDAEFQAKCLGKMNDVGRKGRTVLFVSHNIPAVKRLCDRALWFENGSVRMDGPATEVASKYLSTGLSTTSNWTNVLTGDRREAIEFIGARILSAEGKPVNMVNFDSPFSIQIEYELFQALRSLSVICQLTNASGEPIWTSWDTDSNDWMSRVREVGMYRSICRIPGNTLGPGTYCISVGSRAERARFAYHERILSFVVSEIGYPLNPGRQGIIRPILEWDVSLNKTRVSQ
jgi:lipopolysaccharide transport system ATP-binding protein